MTKTEKNLLDHLSILVCQSTRLLRLYLHGAKRPGSTSNTFLPDPPDLSDLSDLCIAVSEEHTSLHLETS